MSNTKSRILDEEKEMRESLFVSGVIIKRQLSELEKHYKLDLPELKPRQIKSLREKAYLS
jgi:DNA-binding transcriptional regulator YiaG